MLNHFVETAVSGIANNVPAFINVTTQVYHSAAKRLDILRRLPPESLFVRAAARGDLATVQAFLAPNEQGPGIDPNIFSRHDRTNALLAASANAQSDVVKVLLDAGARIDTPTAQSQNCLHLAASADLTYSPARITIVDLLAAGADPRAQDDQGREPFVVCAAQADFIYIRPSGAYLVRELAFAALFKETDPQKRQALANKMKNIPDMGQSFETIAELVATSVQPTAAQKQVLRKALENRPGYVPNLYRALCVHKLDIDGVALTQEQACALFKYAVGNQLFGSANDVLASCPQHAQAMLTAAQALNLTAEACVRYLSEKALALTPAEQSGAPAPVAAVPALHYSTIVPGVAGTSPRAPALPLAMV